MRGHAGGSRGVKARTSAGPGRGDRQPGRRRLVCAASETNTGILNVANHKSALKRIRQTEKHRRRNQRVRTGMRTEIKNFRAAVEAGDATVAAEKFASAERAIRRAASKGVIPRQRADRSVSRLAKNLNQVAQS